MRRALCAALGVLAALALSPASAGAACWTYSKADRILARKTNQARAARDLPKLKLDAHLARVARKHTNEMIAKETLYHTPPDVLAYRVTRWTALGENVGYGNGPRHLHRMFMDSKAHRANILRARWRYFGVASRRHDGSLWVTVIFESRRDPGTRLAMPDC